MFDTMGSWAAIVGWIFGGCCSNVYALEAIIKDEPGSGLLITFAQFLLTALVTWPTHFSPYPSQLFVKPRAVPVLRWIPNIAMFFTVNLLNNSAFGYNISVPVHIILRSGGSVLTMLVGYVWGRRYTRTQVSSVVMLTVGIITAAMADAQSKGKAISSASVFSFDPELLRGLSILFVAQLLSAIMGLYVQLTYATYGSHWHENLFYSHALSVPLFLPFAPSLLAQVQKLFRSPPVNLSPSIYLDKINLNTSAPGFQLPPILLATTTPAIPIHIFSLLINAITQFACIRGVNLLASQTSAIGVSIALNLRKLISLFISIKLFGNVLPFGVKIGAAIVFASAGLWAWEERRLGLAGRKNETEIGGAKKIQ